MELLALLEATLEEEAPELAVPEVPAWLLEGPTWDEPSTCGCGSSGDPVEALARAARAVVRIDPTSLAEEVAADQLQTLLTVAQQLRVHQVARVADVAERRLHLLMGHRSPAAWVRAVQPDVDGGDVKLGRDLLGLPYLARAVERGEVSLRAARSVSAALDKCRPYLDQPDGLVDGQPGEETVGATVDRVIDLICRARFGVDVIEPDLLDAVDCIHLGGGSQLSRIEQACVLLARELDARSLQAGLRDLVYALLPGLLERENAAAEERAEVWAEQQPGGSWKVHGTLSPQCGERLFMAVSAEAAREVRDPEELASAEAEGSAGPRRTKARRMHDALDRLLERYLGAGLGGTHDKVPVQMTVTLTDRAVEGQLGALPGKGASGRPLARSVLRRWWCDAQVTALLLSRGWKPLGLVHTGRTLSGTERRAIRAVFDNRCAGVGCCPANPDPLVPLVPHHVRRFADDGVTCIEESLLVCPTLHLDLHTGKKTVRLRDGRRVNEEGWVT